MGVASSAQEGSERVCSRICLPSATPASALPSAAVGRQAGWGLGATWWALVAFYITRLTGHALHFWRTGGGVFAGRLAGGSSGDNGSESDSGGAHVHAD